METDTNKKKLLNEEINYHKKNKPVDQSILDNISFDEMEGSFD
jgi:hypothetical protein